MYYATCMILACAYNHVDSLFIADPRVEAADEGGLHHAHTLQGLLPLRQFQPSPSDRQSTAA